MSGQASRRHFLKTGTALSVATAPQLLGVPLFAQGVGKKYAIVVGVADYDPDELNPLRFTLNDAEELAAELTKLQFDVTLMTAKASRPQLKPTSALKIYNVLKNRAAGLNKEDTLVFAFTGHGVQFVADKSRTSDANEVQDLFFCPEDANLEDRSTLLSMDLVQRTLHASQAGRKLLLVDACRNNPQPEGKKKGGTALELEPVGRAIRAVPDGMFAVYSCSSGETSREYPDLNLERTKGHGVFTYHVLRYLRGHAEPNWYPGGELTVTGLAAYVSRETKDLVWSRDNKNQVPVVDGKLTPWSLGKAPADNLLQADKLELVLATCEGTSLAISQDGTRLLTVSSTNDNPQNNYRVWDAANGQLLFAWTAPEGSAFLNHNGTMALNANTFELMDLASGKVEVIDRLSLNSAKAWSISPDMNRLIVDKEIFDRRSDKKIGSFEIGFESFSIDGWSQDGSTFLAVHRVPADGSNGSGNTAWGIFSAFNGDAIRRGNYPSVSFYCYYSSSLRYVCAPAYQQRGNAEILDTKTGQVTAVVDVSDGGVVLRDANGSCQALRPSDKYWIDGRTLNSVGPRTGRRGKSYADALFQYEMGLSRTSLNTTQLEWQRTPLCDLSGLKLSSDGLRVDVRSSEAGCSIDGRYCVASGRTDRYLLIESNRTLLPAVTDHEFFSLSSDNRSVLCRVPFQKQENQNSNPLPGASVTASDYTFFRDKNLVGSFSSTGMPLLSQYGNRILIGEYNGGDSQLLQMETSDMRMTKRLDGFSGRILSASGDGSLLLVASGGFQNDDSRVDLLSDLEQVKSFSGKRSGALSLDGKLAVVLGDKPDPITLWNVATVSEVRNLRCSLDPSEISQIQFSNTNSLVALVDGQKVEVVRVSTGQPAVVIDVGNWIESLQISSDEKWVVTIDAKRVRWWSIETGRWQLQLQYLSGSDWVCTAPDNRYDASPTARELVVWKRKNSQAVFSSAAVQSRLYTPGLMGQVLRAAI